MEHQPKKLTVVSRAESKRGIALVLVLAFLVLLTGLLIAFFSSASFNLSASSSYANGAVTRQLSDSTVNYAMAQIKTATTGTDTAWASQPGMIRTYDNSGNKLAYYKLYSSNVMVVNKDDIPTYNLGDDLKVSAGDAATTWASRPAIFTDLNAPVKDVSGTDNYPIVDPTAVADGFNLTNDPANNPVVSGANPAPMPVKWLYVLKSGALTAPSAVDATGKISSWTGVTPAPSAANPIVGRVAFWTDDESCKLNLNTASEPTAWASPMAVTIQDLNYGKYQPAQKEFQRFPGHPFSTALSPVLFPGTTGDLSATQMQQIYSLIPRAQWGGSKAATVDVTNAGYAPVTPDKDRLFASMDEALFPYPSAFGSPRNANATFSATLEKARFFLTTNSRAPEVNLFGKPRISIWPVPSVVDPANPTATESSKQTPYDRLARFCSTIGKDTALVKKPYGFQRSDPFSPTADYANISRNKDLYKYLQDLTSQPIPGYGGNFLSKWGNDRDQVLTEMFDYIRSTDLRDPLLVQRDSTGKALNADLQPYVYSPIGQVAPIKIGSTQGFGRFHTISQFGLHFIAAANNTNGTLSGRNDIFKGYSAGVLGNYTTDPSSVGVSPSNAQLVPSGQTAVEVAFFMEPFSPSVGFYQLQESISYEVSFNDAMKLENSPLFPTSTKTAKSVPPLNTFDSGFTAGITHGDGRAWGGSAGIRGPIKQLGFFVGNLVLVGPGTMRFSGGTITVKVYSGTGVTTATPGPTSLIQTFTINFPPADFPIPALVTTGTTKSIRANDSIAKEWWAFNNWREPTNPPATTPYTQWTGRYPTVNQGPHSPGSEYTDTNRRWGVDSGNNQPGFKRGGIFRAEDVVRTMVPEHGDLRLVAASADPSALFVKGTNYENTNVRFDHLLSEVEGSHFLFGFSNEPGPDPVNAVSSVLPIKGTALTDQLVPSGRVRYHYSRLPKIRPGAGKTYNHWNDFDNGMSYVEDGAYINKPDEGNISAAGTTYPYFGYDFDVDTARDNLFSPSRLVPSAGMFGSLPTGVKRNRPWETLLFHPFTSSNVLTQSGTHPGAQSPKDHLIMDLFWMPVIEPYAISEPFSTAGKVNLNYQIAPFTYIRRATALYGAFKSEQPLILPNSDNPESESPGNRFYSKIYKLWKEHTNDDKYPNDAAFPSLDPQVRDDWGKLFAGAAPFDKLRRPINMTETLKQSDDRFNGTGDFSGNPDIFRSATEVCELHLVRQNESLSDYISGKIWDSALLTGDNARERPYTNLYAKLTTRSNVYTVHMRVQSLKKTRNTDPTQWDETKDRIVGEYRGSAMIERYIDPADSRLVDYATTSGNVDANYKFRVLNTKKFP